MRVVVSPKPEILNDRKEARFYVRVENEVESKNLSVSVFVVKDHKLINDVSWAPLEAKIVKLSYDFFEDFLVSFAIPTGDVQKVLEEATSTVEAFESLLREHSKYLYDFQVKEIYRLDFADINLYLLKTRRVKASSLKEKQAKMKELKNELRDNCFEDKDISALFEDKDIPTLQVISEYGQYKVPFDITRDESGEPLSKFVLINEEEAKEIVEEALERNLNGYKYPPLSFFTSYNPFSEKLPIPKQPKYSVLYLSRFFRQLIYNKEV